MSGDPVLVFYNQSNRTSHENWDFDVTGYLERSAAGLLYDIQKANREFEDQNIQQ